jgi:DNA polymerase-3 subunit alpha
VNWAKDRGIFVGPGRGSAAGSLVTYALNITNINPITYSLIFERFLNPERISMPDIDIDFSDTRRDEVLKYVAEKYGKDHVAQIITFGTMAARGAVRDSGRALGYSYEFCDRIAKIIPFLPNQGQKSGYLAECVRGVPEVSSAYHGDPQAKALIDAAMRLEGVVRHASTHACAVVITPEPLTHYLPLQQGTKPGDIITQYEMHAVEDLGLLKMDFLGLSNLSIIEDTLKLISRHHNTAIDIERIPLDDQATFTLLQEARTTGVFQLESAGMKRYLKGLKPTEFEDVLSMVALYRPGPMDAIPDFIDAKHGRKKVTYLHSSLEPILKDSYGVIVTQDQVLQVARTFAGFTYSEADILRKAVGKKIKSLLDKQKEKFCQGAIAQGHSSPLAEQVWNFIEPFARYGFNRAHAACYGMIAYQTAYLKAHWPTEFMTAFMNSETGDVERVAFLISEARDMGIDVLPPDINYSHEQFSVTGPTHSSEPTIRFGLTAVKNVGTGVVQSIIAEREENGLYQDAENLVTRLAHRASAQQIPGTGVNRKSLEALIKCGACDSLYERNALLANLDTLLSHAREKQKNASMGQVSLFGDEANTLPPMKFQPAEAVAEWDKLNWEKELLGLYVSDHPLNRYQARLALEKVTAIRDLKPVEGAPAKIAGLITSTRRITTKTGKPMLFSQVEDLTSRIEVVVFPSVLEKTPNAWQENTLVILKGKVNNRDGETKILCDAAKALDMLTTPASPAEQAAMA